MSNVDASQLAPIKGQVATCIPHNWMSKCWGFVVVNNGWLLDLLKLQVLQCINYKFEPASSNALTFPYYEYSYANCTCKIVCLEKRFRDKMVELVLHTQQPGEKKQKSIWLCNYMIFWWYKLKFIYFDNVQQ